MSNLSGFWVGQYSYEDSSAEPVDFDAEITQDGQTLSGITTEPNSFDPNGGELLTASITGATSGAALTFLKVYHGDESPYPPITYNGSLAADQQSINGIWMVDDFSGTFDMRRDGPEVGVKANIRTASLEQVLEKAKKR